MATNETPKDEKKDEKKGAKAGKKAPAVFMVRLKKYNPQRGYKLRQFHVFGHRFEEERGWYKVNEFVTDFDHKTGERLRVNLIEYLRDVRQNAEDPDSKLAFDVCTEEQAAKLDEDEEEEIAARARANDVTRGRSAHPNDLTTRDIRNRGGDDDASARRRNAAIGKPATTTPDGEEPGEDFDPDEDLGAKNE